MEFHDNTYPLPNWLLRINEASNGHFIVSLTDHRKRRIELTCTDGEVFAKVQQCIEWAKQTNADERIRTSTNE